MELKCPNCGGPTRRDGDVWHCIGECGGSFKFRAGEAKLVGVGEFAKLRETTAALEREVKELREALGRKPAEPETPVEIGWGD